MKRIVALILCLLMLIPATAANAAGSTSFLNFYEITKDSLYLYGKELPQGGKVTVSVDTQVIPGADYTSVDKEKLPVTVYCLVDITSDMTDAQVRQQKDFLNTISSRMRPNDSMVIATLGSDFTEGQPLTTQEARKTAIDTLRRKGKTPQLFDAVIKSVQSLETKTTFATNRCLVVLSDGYNDDKDGIKEQQVWDCIKESEIPVFGIANVKQSGSSYARKYANNVIRMGQESVGGFGLDPQNDGISAAAAAESVWVAIQNGFVFSIPIMEIDSRSNTASVSVIYETKDTRLEDSITVSLVDVPEVKTETTEETEPAASPDTEDSKTPNIALLIGIVLACVAVIAAVVVVIVRRKKTSYRYKKEMEDTEETAFVEIESISDIPECTVPVEPQVVAPQLQETQKDDVKVQFVAILHSDVVCAFGLTTHIAKTVGRSKQADVCLNSGDSKLSGKHCLVEWDGHDLYMKDIGSTNGTSLNGSPIKPNTWHRLPNNVKVRLGEYEYRVSTEII